MTTDQNHLYPTKTTLITPDGEILDIQFYFKPEDVYTVDGWYFCPETEDEWYIVKSKTIFTGDRVDEKLGRLYYSPEFGFCTKKECERFLKLKPFW